MMTKSATLPLKSPSITAVIVERIEKRTIRRALLAGADALEIRVDTFSRRDPEVIRRDIERLRGYEGAAEVPLIITCRDRGEGGARGVGASQKREIFRAVMPLVQYVDIEIRKASLFGEVIGEAGRAGVGVIMSYHDFRATPGAGRLEAVIKKGFGSEGDVVKIAATVRTLVELRRLASLLLGEAAPLIVIAMGPLGRASRVFFPLLGSLTTYGSVTSSSAPGQLSVRELAAAFRTYGIGRGQVG